MEVIAEKYLKSKNIGQWLPLKNPNISYTPEEVVLDVSNLDEARKAMGLDFERAVV